jgi:mycoredoxin
MKKTIFIIFFVIPALGWGMIHTLLTSTPDFAALHKENVILYGTSWCENCAKTRQFLTTNHIPYFEYDVDNSSEGQEQFKQLHGTGVPVILVKTEVIQGFDPHALFQALKRNHIVE